MHLTETCKSWLHAKNLLRALWVKGMKCATYVINRMPLCPINMKSPYELIFEERLNVKHLKFLGLFAMSMCPHFKELNLMQKQENIFVGYDNRKKGWKCMDPKTHFCCCFQRCFFL